MRARVGNVYRINDSGSMLIVIAISERYAEVVDQAGKHPRRILLTSLRSSKAKHGYTLMGIGVYLAIIMFLNVWGVIWPNQKRALGIVEADADTKAKAAKIAGQFSRINTLLSIPMLVAMTMHQTLVG